MADKHDESYATKNTIDYIQKLEHEKTVADAAAANAATALAVSKRQQKTIQKRHGNAKALSEAFEGSVDLAEQALKDVMSITGFFQVQRETTQKLTEHAREMSESIYGAVATLISEGTARVGRIKELVEEDEKVDPEAWAGQFEEAVANADSAGKTARESGEKATRAAFVAYASNQSIYVRTSKYASCFENFESYLSKLVDRLTKEETLATARFDGLEKQLKETEKDVNDKTAKAEDADAKKERANRALQAAREGASAPAPAPAA